MDGLVEVDAIGDVLEVDPDLADAKFYLGETYYQLKEPSKALAVYKEALRMNPGDADTHRRLGDLHLEKGEIDQIVDTLRDALAVVD